MLDAKQLNAARDLRFAGRTKALLDGATKLGRNPKVDGYSRLHRPRPPEPAQRAARRKRAFTAATACSAATSMQKTRSI